MPMKTESKIKADKLHRTENQPYPISITVLNKNISSNTFRIMDDENISIINANDDDIKYLNTAESMDGISGYCIPNSYNIDLIIEEDAPHSSTALSSDLIDTNKLICRLCANYFPSNEHLRYIFDNTQLVENIQKILPNMVGNRFCTNIFKTIIINTCTFFFKVYSNDGLPQSICTTCVDRLNICVESLDSFKQAQDQIRATFIGNVQQ